MKRILTVGLAVVLAIFLSVVVIYAIGNKVKENQKLQTEKVTTKAQTEKVTTMVPGAAIRESEKHPHAEGSAGCIEKHNNGECQGHKSGEKHSENNSK